jgi:UDP-glucose 4-epimerase
MISNNKNNSCDKKNSADKKTSCTILVTGGAGYIGSHSVLALIKNGYNVVIFDSLELGHAEIIDKLKTIEADGKIIDFIEGDLKKSDDISAVFKKHEIDAVIHFAAYISVGESVENPHRYYANNVVGSLNLFGAMLKSKVTKIVFSSTAAVYGEPEYVPIDENHRMLPINPYGWSKFIVEKILSDYDSSNGIKSVCLRYFNVAGADEKSRIGEWHEPETHLIPNILIAASSTDKIFQIYGNDFDTRDGTCIRDYVNVEDLADAHLLALRHLLSTGMSDCFNLGTNDGSSVKEVFDACEKIIGKKIKMNISDRRSGDPAILVACNQKSKKILKWTPKKTLTDSIQSAYNWQLAFLKNDKKNDGKQQ